MEGRHLSTALLTLEHQGCSELEARFVETPQFNQRYLASPWE